MKGIEFILIEKGECKTICKDYIGVLGHYDLSKTNDIPICINCGQCANVCPVDSIVETYEFRDVMNAINDKDKIVSVALTPCTAKKFEIRRDEMKASSNYLNIDDMRDMDHVITTRELALWAKEKGIDFNSLEDSEFDKVMGEASGAGVIFGNTGGVMEAALRTAYEFVTKEKVPIRILTGNYLNITQPQALYLLKDIFRDTVDLRFYKERKR